MRNRTRQALAVVSVIAALLTDLPVHAELSGAELEEAQQALQAGAEEKRREFANLSFEEFKARVYREPFANGKYIVNGDTALVDEKHLREFYEQHVAVKSPEPGELSPEFIVATVGGLTAVWNDQQKRALTYCVSRQFGSRYDAVNEQMAAAARAWESVADLDFIHLAAEDERCDATNPQVVFDVRPVQVNGQYLARAFFPNEPRGQRNVLIDGSSFDLNPTGKLQLVGILRHELGHTIGARHEHTRPDSGTCFEDTNWQPLTDYDPFSVMHYPQCNGMGDWSLTLTHQDQNGVACLYGPAGDFVIDPAICSGLGVSEVKTFDSGEQIVAADEEKRYGTQNVRAGSRFTAEIEGIGSQPGDPDLYLKFNGTPQVGLEYDCRPYLSGANERCDVDVPAGASIARVMVHGYRDGRYRLKIRYQEP